MIQIRKSSERGHFDHGWLDTRHTFSFASYRDPQHMGFRSLRVMNEDVIAPAQGFGTHPHRDMEIITYVLQGALRHEDSMGNGEVLSAGEFQRMSAGSGISHSEMNASSSEPVHLYQIWLLPREKGIEPGYQQRRFPDDQLRNRLRLVASAEGEEESLSINQNARVYLSSLADGKSVAHTLSPGRYGWLQVLRGGVIVNGQPLEAGDGAAISEERELQITANPAAEIMLFALD